ncbi:MAG: hypothetical protein IT285_08165 [Bdellovibrionales bacterium]|nr:hypothetical protein [Bdellovibrionales bacterium]
MKSLFALLVASLSLASSLPALAADEGTFMTAFFETLEDEWRYTGEGTHRRLTNDGLMVETAFDVELNVSGDTFKPQWDLNTRFSYSTGASLNELTRFAVRGDRLFMGNASGLEPVTILAAEPTRLEYRFTRSYQGYLYTYTHRLTLAEDGTLNVYSTLEVNGGVVIEEQEWAAR